MRLFPELSILSPGDPNEVERCMEFIFSDNHPKYLRLRKAGEPKISTYDNSIAPGEWQPIIIKNSKKILLSTGYGLKIAEELSNKNDYKDFSLYSCPVWGQKYSKQQIKYINRFEKIITVEDHIKSGGFGSWLIESTNNNNKIESICINDSVIGMVGSEDYLLNKTIK